MAANKRRPGLELPSDIIAGVPPEYRELALTIQHRLKVCDELLESAAGFRGTVQLAAQKHKDERGLLIPGLTMEGNRIADAADPKDPQDLVTFGYLKKLLTCQNLTRIIGECWEISDRVDDEVEIVSTPALVYSYFYGYTVFRLGTSINTNIGAANQTSAWLFPLPYPASISRATFEVMVAGPAGSLGSVGLYNDAGSLVCTTGGLSIATTGLKSGSFTAVSLDPGMYYLAITANQGFTYKGINVVSWAGIGNANSVKYGKGTNSAGGVLNSSLGSLTSITDRPPQVLFE